ncbi:putative bifunctional diguanylate cyclase/phosphodiesterase [Rhizobium halophytocola]|uniref:Diguanylate cyclase (GGDEF)-like protein n=1 Tax=Rhizobium halophytocola TaxID=735519 RepID=A0ABS4DYC8_9HYPH|nr:GGDEF domain-containing phosphodiesterase [Rhizobium halophytocola]MBP1850696.1 diguanylate cyclase (GGDEF)-like protein [Rhizobium halophytocola]
MDRSGDHRESSKSGQLHPARENGPEAALELTVTRDAPQPSTGAEVHSPAALKALYKTERGIPQLRETRHGLWLAAIVYLLFGISDAILIPDVSGRTIAARFVVAILSMGLMELLVAARVPSRWSDIACAGIVIAAYVGWLIPALGTEAHDNFRFYMLFGTIFMMSANLFFNLFFRLSVITSATIMVIFLVSLAFTPPLTQQQSAVVILFYISCFVFTSYVNWKLNKERYQVFLNAHEAERQHDEATNRGRQLYRMSTTDYLTGVDNRRAIDKRLQECWDAWVARETAFAVILFDIDLFKRYNDCYGHQAGDACLTKVARAINTELQKHGVSFGRYGGEEFIAIVQLPGKAEVLAIAETIRRTVEDLQLRHEQRKDGTNVVTVSVGMALSRQSTNPGLDKIIHEADLALYSAKREGRNCVHFFDPRDPQSADETDAIAATLRAALENDLVTMAYQPIISLSNGKIEAYEALMRMKMFDGTPISPSRFIPIAEDTGMILPLGLWAIRRACLDLLLSDRTPLVSVNISRVQLKSPNFVRNVADLLRETGVEGRQLAFEITEGLDLDGQVDALRCLRELSDLGIRIWLDDFGTGFAGLSWLRMFPFDTVKIDRSFLHDASTDAGREMLQDIIELVRRRGARILVEGAEDAAQLELARSLGVQQIQGYHTGRPAPAAQAPVMSGVAPDIVKDTPKPRLLQVHPPR